MSELTLDDLWVMCMALGGTLTRDELEATLAGRYRPNNAEHDLIAQALNDYFTERGQDHPVAYSHELDPSDAGDDRR